MALTLQDILNDAKKLSSRLRDRESAADVLVTQMQSFSLEVEAMKQFNEDISQLNGLASSSSHPRMALVAGLQHDSKYIKDLQRENKDLKIALEEQQNAMDLIMSKYRQQVSKLMQCEEYDQQLLKSLDANTKALESGIGQLNEMKGVMREAISIDGEGATKEEELIRRLWTENKGLREMLQISHRFSLPEEEPEPN